ncbi:FAD-binding oxidoreductase [Bradyrhizobium sp. AUGA SZCCT0222]|uniref:NAD(P)/FAD-dependent oxidoreductase n=1 Tax=Bradyrhizobium sp. AUGA SZCCT0222 TaxID=2807668 RepID=UPI001BA4BDE3|nr:FAD-binding oxidoreductase [Bradyrhizobium sp. AUGA SZCCT0222]MBR1268127.1 FAD-binding oxidoreductase [Bradyrhizobium sp. AUGA SZCCT0222]
MTVTHHPLALPPSLYADTAVAPVATPPLDIDKTVSVAIIGGGFAGLSTALHLAEAGADAIVLEAQQPGWGASGNNGGQLNPGLKLDPDTIAATFGADLGRRMIAFSYNTPVFTLDLIRRLAIPCEARQNGTLRAAYHPSSTAGVEITAEQCIRRGMPVTVLGRDAVREATGTDRYLLAMKDARGGDVQPLSYARGLARAAMAAGAAVHGETPATSLRREGGRWRIETPRAVVRAEKVLIATNGFTDDLWPDLRRTIVPVFSSIAATEPLPDEVARKIMPTRSVLYESGHITVYYRIDASNRLLMGGRGPMQWIKDPAPVSYLMRYAERLWLGIRGARWTHGWNSRLAMTPDHYPHVHEPGAGALAYLGCNGRGVALATAMGQQLAKRLIGGEKAEIDMPITGLKPIRFHALWPVAVKSVVMTGRIRDRLGL